MITLQLFSYPSQQSFVTGSHRSDETAADDRSDPQFLSRDQFAAANSCPSEPARPAKFTLLGSEQGPRFATVDFFSRTLGRVLLTSPVSSGAPVEIEWSGVIYYGTVLYCVREGNRFVTELEVEHWLDGNQLAGILAQIEPADLLLRNAYPGELQAEI